jgi:hypothetical protein
VIGNLIEQGKNTGNRTILTYLEEGMSSFTSGADLHVINNTFVNDLRDPLSNFIRLGSGASPAVITNNIFNGPGVICELQSGTACDATAATLTTNFVGDPLFVNATNFDYHLTATSPAIDQGSDVGSLTPTFEYVHPACGEQRITTGAGIDIGAYEFGGAGTPLVCR